MKDVALIGKAGSGKDTVARLLDEAAPGFIRLAFADQMKWFYHAIFTSVPPEPKPRKGYQWFGQMMRSHDADVWIKHMAGYYSDIKEWMSNPVVITDVRQPNEYEWCKANGFVVVKVTASDDIRLERLKNRGDSFKPEDLSHETESYIDTFEYDFFIDNSGTIEDLKPQIKQLVGALTGRSV